MKIIIIGAGIGGLTAAIGLARNGHQVEVLERVAKPKPVGAGISLQPNAMIALGMLGLDASIRNRDEAVVQQHDLLIGLLHNLVTLNRQIDQRRSAF